MKNGRSFGFSIESGPRTMVRDIRERKGFSTDPADVENEANVSAKYVPYLDIKAHCIKS